MWYTVSYRVQIESAQVLTREIADKKKRRELKEQKKLYGDLSRLKRQSEKNLMSIQEEEEIKKTIVESMAWIHCIHCIVHLHCSLKCCSFPSLSVLCCKWS